MSEKKIKRSMRDFGNALGRLKEVMAVSPRKC